MGALCHMGALVIMDVKKRLMKRERTPLEEHILQISLL